MATHAVLGKKPDFFDLENMVFIQKKLTELFKSEFKQNIVFDPASIVSAMYVVYYERIEAVPRMNYRVVMYLMAHFRNQQTENNKYLMFAESYSKSQQLFEPYGNKGVDLAMTRGVNRLGRRKVGSTTNFVFL